MNKPTRKEAIETKCKDCCGEYYDGKEDCEVTICPLYTYMPYNKLEANLELFKYSPKHKGKVLKEDAKPKLSKEQRKAAADRLKAARNKGDK